jgi:glycerol-3-phosphate dehydrogenase (NAD(P)+)
MTSISIIGAGAWGTALAMAAERSGVKTMLWGRRQNIVKNILKTRENKERLPGIALSPNIAISSNLDEACQAEILLLATSAQSVRDIVSTLTKKITLETCIVICSKGIEIKTSKLLTEVVNEILPKNPIAVLSGPSFAIEVAQKLPTALTIASEKIHTSRWLANLLNSHYFRLYPSEDIIGVQLGGAIKNVIAIAAGIAMSKRLGNNAQAALITRGLAEICRLGIAKGAYKETFSGLSGIGDLALTCSAKQSRNMSLGFLLGEGESIIKSLASRTSTTEGVSTSKTVMALSQKFHVDMPICSVIYKVLYEDLNIESAINELLSHSIRDELPANIKE